MPEDLKLQLEIVDNDLTGAMLRGIVDVLKAVERQAERTGKALWTSLGAELSKPLAAARVEAKAFGADLAEGAERAAKALRVDVVALTELRSSLRGAVADEKALGAAVRSAQAGNAGAVRRQTTAARNAASGRARAANDEFRGWRQTWRRRQASERADAADLRRKLSAGRYLLRVRQRSERLAQREAERIAKAEATATRTRERTEAADLNRRMRGMRYLSGVRKRSERAELAGIARVRRERLALRREAGRSWREAGRSTHHALRSVNHPELSSVGFWLQAGATFGVEAGHHLIEAARDIDASITRMKMLPGVSAADTIAVRHDALRESMQIGVDPAEIVKLQVQAIKDGLSPTIAKSLPAIVNAAVQTMGGSIDKDGDELAKAVREANTVGWVKDAAGARSLMNQVAGLSTYNGNSPEKMQQFLASGGIGRGAELGWTQQQTLAFGAALNGSGEKTGFGSARLMAQISEIRASMVDRYRHANLGTEEGRSTRAAPHMLGYGSIHAMSAALATPEGLSELFSRFAKLDESKRASIEKGYGFGPQFNAVSAEMGADGGKRYRDALAREQELSSQTAENDDLAKNSRIWSTSIEAMMGRIRSTTKAVESELGDVIKDDILTPFTGWWTEIGAALLDGGLKERFHNAVMSFVHGLGFEDVAALLRDVSGHVHSVDFAGFMRGIGEGVRSSIDSFRMLAGVFGAGAGGISAETIGKTAAELFSLSVALRAVDPALNIMWGVIEAIRAIGAMAGTLRALAGLAGMAGAAEGVGAAAGVAGAGALLPVAIAAMTLGSIAVAVVNWREMVDGIADVWSSLFGGDKRSEGFSEQVRRHARAAAGDDIEAQKRWTIQHRRADYDPAWGHHGRDADSISTPDADRATAQDRQRRALGLDGGRSADAIRAALAFDPKLLGSASGDRAAKIQAEMNLLQGRLDAMAARPAAPPRGSAIRSPAGELPAMPMRYEGGDDPNNWRNLLTRASYEPSDSGNIVRNATVDTARGVVEVREAVDRLGTIMRTATLSGSGSGSGGGSGGAGLSNMRYGRTSSGAYLSSPGGSGAGGGGGMTAAFKDLTPESRAFLDTLASGEAPDYNVMNGGGRFSDYSHHPGGRAAGRYQFLPSTWRRVSAALGLHDFSPESQDKGAWWLAQQDYRSRTGRDLSADLRSKDPARIAAVGRALHPTWVSLNGSFGGKYQRYLDRQSSGAVPAGGGGASAPGQVRGNLKIGDETFRYGSGGAGGSASIPFGDYPINPDAQGPWGRAHGAMAVNGTGAIWDKALGRMRTGIEMHAASTAEMVTHGCLGFMRSEYPRLKARVREMIAKTGHAYLHVGPNGATITPNRDDHAAELARKVGVVAHPSAKPATPDDIARKVMHGSRPRPGTGDPPSGGTSADNSSSIYNFHIHEARDAHHVARTVAGYLGHSGGMTVDRDMFA